MNTSVQKLSLIHWITEIKDTSTLDVLEIIKKQSEKEGWWNNISIAEKMSIEHRMGSSCPRRIECYLWLFVDALYPSKPVYIIK
jgi:hypothetical protein